MATLTILMFFTAVFIPMSGCINSNGGQAGRYGELEKISLADTVMIHPDYADALPFLSGYVLNRDLSVEAGVEGITFDNLSQFSSELALSLWKSPNTAFVVDTYENALKMATPSKLLDAPILLYGPTTAGVLDELQPAETVVVGDADVQGDRVLKGRNILRYTAGLLQSQNISEGYVSVVNIENSSSNFKGLAEFGSLLCAYRDGVVVTVNFSIGKEEIKERIQVVEDVFNESDIRMEYLCLVGGMDVVPSHQMEVQTGGDPPVHNEFFTDHYYCSGVNKHPTCCGGGGLTFSCRGSPLAG